MSKHNAEAVAVQIEEQWGNIFVATAVRSIGEENAKLREELAAWKASAIEREALCVKMEAELPKVIAQLEAAEARIGLLAEVIQRACVAAGIITDGVSLTGPQVLLFGDDLVGYIPQLKESEAKLKAASEQEYQRGYDYALTAIDAVAQDAYQRGRADERAEAEKEEPVGEVGIDTAYEDLPNGTKLYTRPLAQKPLSDVQISLIEFDIAGCAGTLDSMDKLDKKLLSFARSIEAAHGITGNKEG